ncbi:MAG: IPT/TIG domain-containing protein [Methylobacter sp.]|jgi:hypothetical protein|nr:IPT/TIG domain-containing protein [Methylobacter sp.]
MTKENNPNEGYVTQNGIRLIALYLTVITLGTIAGLVLLWPSCATVNWASSAVSDLTVTSISPGSGVIKGGTLASIRGTGFADGVTVSFGEIAAAEVRIVDSTHLRVLSPEHKKGVFDIVVTNPDKKSRALSPGFFYVDPNDPLPKPSIKLLSPVSGPLTGGQPVTIKGTGLQNVTTVSFDGLPGTNIQVMNDTTLVATTPAHGEGKVDVAVDAGTTATLSEGYTYTCWSIVPTHLFIMVILAGALGGCLHGLRSLVWHVGDRNLQNSRRLKYFFLPLIGAAIGVIFFLAVSAGLYKVQGTENMILIGLSGLVGMFSDEAVEKLKKIAEGLLTEAPHPQEAATVTTVSVTSVSPNFGSTTGNTGVTIAGKGFDIADVRFGENDATVKNLTQTSITATTPAHKAGKVDVFVINKNGQSFTLRDGYEYK